MTINEIIEKCYNDLHNTVTPDRVISNSVTEEDLLNNMCIQAINKFKDQDISFEEGLNYLKKFLKYEQKFQYKRKNLDPHLYMASLPDISDSN